MCVRAFVCMQAYVCIQNKPLRHTQRLTWHGLDVCVHKHIYACLRKYARIHMRGCVYVHTYLCKHMYIHLELIRRHLTAYVHMYIHIRMYIYMYM